MNYDLGFDFEEAISRQNISKSDIVSLREPAIPGVPATITDKLLILFITACGSVDEARKVIKIYYDARKTSPNIFNKRDPFSEEIQQCLDNQIYLHLPVTPNGYNLIFHRLQNPKASNYIMEPAVKTYFMTLDSCFYENGPRNGLICLFDMKNFRLTHLTRVRLGALRKFFHYVQEALPAKLFQIHIFNTVSYFDRVMSIIKPFMHSEIFNQMYLHPPTVDYDKFSEEFNIPKSCLPSDFGGILKSTDELHTDFIESLREKRKYFIAEEMQRSDLEISDDDLIEKNMKNLKVEEVF